MAVKANGTMSGKKVVVSFDENGSVVRIESKWGLATHQFVGANTPEMMMEADTLIWSEFSVQIDSDPDELQRALQICNLVNQRRQSATAEAATPPGILPSKSTDRASSSATAKAHAKALSIASSMEMFAWILLALGVIGGIVLALQEVKTCSLNSAFCDTSRPYIGAGVGLAVAAAFNAGIVIMVAAYIQARLAPEDASPGEGSQRRTP
ncbi:MAG: hypothetical protein ACOYMR_14410 [Ilumatobacteraceae bacterium]